MNQKICIVWTRVSTKHQEDNGGSLDYQKQVCEAYAKNNGYIIKGYYGGTHESAKTPGKLVTAMLSAVRKDKSITHIIVSELDRFSRDAGQSISIINNLRKSNCTIIEAKTGTTTETKEGRLMAGVKLCMAQWDNENRTDKFVAGRKHCFESGVWCGKRPLGYDKEGKSLGAKYTINSTGRLLRKAFIWKLEGLNNFQILDKLSALGLHLSKQSLHKILTNPFYAGKIKHKMVVGLIDGIQEPLLSYAQFVQVQEILSGKTGVYTHKKETPRFPLKRFVLCGEDHKPMTAYTVKAKNIDYYKCNQKGCKTNVSAKKLHRKYVDVLQAFSIPECIMPIFSQIIKQTLHDHSTEQAAQSALLKKQLSETENKIKKVKIRFGMGEIDEDIYAATIANLQDQKAKITVELEKCKLNLSNLEKQVDRVLATCCKLGDMWQGADLELCQKIQKMTFPNGIEWDKRNDNYRTFGRNHALDVLCKLSDDYENKKEAKIEILTSSVNLCG